MDLHCSVTEYFYDAVSQALRSQRMDVQENTEFYLVNLLAEFANARRVDEEPLALKMAQATTASSEERARTLKEVGDTTLYISGFFADSLTRKSVDVDYYIAIGGSAYGQLAKQVMSFRRSNESLRDVYDELSEKFPRFVEVLQEVREQSNFSSGTNIIRLYEEWKRTGSDWMERRLRATALLSAEAFSSQRIIH